MVAVPGPTAVTLPLASTVTTAVSLEENLGVVLELTLTVVWLPTVSSALPMEALTLWARAGILSGLAPP